MASHLSSIGIPAVDRDSFDNYLMLTFKYGTKIKTSIGSYVVWAVGNGVELWGQLDNNGNAIGLNPYFSGNTQIRIKIDEIIRRKDDSALDGAIHCWADPTDNDDTGSYPFAFDLPNILTYNNMRLPQVVTAQITGFAHELKAFSNEEEFISSQQEEMKIASRSFIPCGLFNLDDNEKREPESVAIITGHVLETKEIKNPFTNKVFLSAQISTYGGNYDIVADPGIVNGKMIVNGVVSGVFWLTGKIT